MKRFSRCFLFALVAILACFSIAIAGYLISTVVGDVVVNETIVVSSNSFAMNLFPNSTEVYNIVVRNTGPTIVEVSAVAVVAPSGDGVTVELGRLTVVEPYSCVVVPIVVTAANDVVPGKYVVTVTVKR